MRLVRPNILSLAPYSTARDDYHGSDIDVWLDANESPYDNGFNRYPDPRQRALKQRISHIKGIPVESVFLGNGSDEAIDLAFRVFCRPGIDNAVAISPSYGMYAVSAATNDVELREVLLNPDFSLPVSSLLEACDDRTKLIFICSPNNPTANAFDIADILSLSVAFGGIVVVDEAYIDFADKPSLLSRLHDSHNIIVLQTLSKARGMARLRLGMAFAHPWIIELFGRVKYPYNISGLVQATVMHLLDGDIDEQVAEVKAQRTMLIDALPRCPRVLKVYPSDANFLLVQFDDPLAIYSRLMLAGIIVRNRSSMPLCHGCLRITVGTPQQNLRLLETLEIYI